MFNKKAIYIIIGLLGIGAVSYFKGEMLSDYARQNRGWYEIIPGTDVWLRIHNTYPNELRGYRIKLEFYNPNPHVAVVKGLRTEVIHSGIKLPIGVWHPMRVRPNNNRTFNYIPYKSDRDPEYFYAYAKEIKWEKADEEMPFYSMNEISLYDELLYILFKIFRYTDSEEL